MDGIEIKVTGATPLEVLARIGAFGMHCLANTDVCAAASRIYNAEAAKEKAAQLEAAPEPQAAPTPTVNAPTPPAPPPMATTAPVATPAAPVMQAAVTAPSPSPSALSGQMEIGSPTNVPTAPTAAPTYSLDDITRAGADFIVRHPEKQAELNALFPQFGITTLAELRPDQMGPFATAMRALGVSI